MNYFRDNIEAMEPYMPGEQPADVRKVIKLNTNENPYPPSPAVVRAAREFDLARLRLYPDAMAGEFRREAAKLLDVPAEWVLPGDGSDDLIIMIARACLGPGRAVAYPVPTFTFYRTQGEVSQAPIVEVPLLADFALPVEALLAAQAAVTFVASPSSPTGVAPAMAELEALAAGLAGLLVIDEAYVEFAEQTALPLCRRYENVIILRTLSKSYSLAGLRLGFGVANPTLITGLLKAKSIYNVGALPAAMGAAALADQAYARACTAKVKASRATLTRELERIGWCVTPSQANFLLAAVPGGAARARAVYDALKARQILVRYYDQPRLDDKLRITVGTDEENATLVAAVAEMP
jgi:histidinol-phosphate aminotransferase